MNVEQLGLIDRPPSPEEIRRQMRAYTARYIALVALVSLVIGGLIGRFAWQDLGAETALDPPSGWRAGALPLAADGTSTPTLAPLQIYVSGAVLRPQVVEVPGGSLLADALVAAGGPVPEADLDSINLAAPLANHQHVNIPARATTPTPLAPPRSATPSPAAPTSNATPTAQVNLNTATLADLLTLPGIGETRAQAILAYRAQHGNFVRIEDLQRVSGIGPSTYEKLAPYITVGP